MNIHEPIALARDCEAVQVPSGTRIVLPRGTTVRIMQALGDSYTVSTERGEMVRIAGRDADAMGLAAGTGAGADTTEVTSAEDLEKRVWDQLRTCYDPEIPVNIVDLGLVYHCAVTPHPARGYRVEVKMTLTAPGCGMGGVIAADAEAKIAALPGVEQVSVEVVFEPPWNPSMMSEAARLELGMM
jgi:probable FeS assembly SUF system protein SufT